MSKTCSYCGHINDSNTAEKCEVCSESFQRQAVVASQQSSAPARQGQAHGSFSFEECGPPRRTPPQSAAGGQRDGQRHAREHAPATRTSRPVPLEGIITELERNEELPPANYYKIFSVVLLVLMLLPVFLTMLLLSIALVIAFSIVRLQPLAHMFNPIAWMVAMIELMEIFVIGRLRHNDQSAIYRGVIRDDDHHLYIFYLRGLLRTGNLIKGHRVSFQGTWRLGNRGNNDERGTLEVSRGMDLSTGSSITSNWGNPWRNIFFVLLVIFFVLAAWLVMHSGAINIFLNQYF